MNVRVGLCATQRIRARWEAKEMYRRVKCTMYGRYLAYPADHVQEDMSALTQFYARATVDAWHIMQTMYNMIWAH